MKHRLLLATIVAACSFSAHAQVNNGLPDQCPSVASIKSVNLTNITKLENEGVVVGFQYGNKYDTNVLWDVAVMAAQGENNTTNATAKLSHAMEGLELIVGPIGDEQGYLCLYASLTEENAGALAVKPGVLNSNLNNMVNQFKFKH